MKKRMLLLGFVVFTGGGLFSAEAGGDDGGTRRKSITVKDLDMLLEGLAKIQDGFSLARDSCAMAAEFAARGVRTEREAAYQKQQEEAVVRERRWREGLNSEAEGFRNAIEAQGRVSIYGANHWIEGVNHFGAPDGASEAWRRLEERFWKLKEEIKAIALTKELDELEGSDLAELKRELSETKRELLNIARKLQCFDRRIPCSHRKCKHGAAIYPGDDARRVQCGTCNHIHIMHEGCFEAVARPRCRHAGCRASLEKGKAISIDWEAAA
jgi:hypothetical protein